MDTDSATLPLTLPHDQPLPAFEPAPVLLSPAAFQQLLTSCQVTADHKPSKLETAVMTSLHVALLDPDLSHLHVAPNVVSRGGLFEIDILLAGEKGSVASDPM